MDSLSLSFNKSIPLKDDHTRAANFATPYSNYTPVITSFPMKGSLHQPNVTTLRELRQLGSPHVESRLPGPILSTGFVGQPILTNALDNKSKRRTSASYLPRFASHYGNQKTTPTSSPVNHLPFAPVLAGTSDNRSTPHASSRFSRLSLQHGNPTVAGSLLTASTSVNDMSRPALSNPKTINFMSMLSRKVSKNLIEPRFDNLEPQRRTPSYTSILDPTSALGSFSASRHGISRIVTITQESLVHPGTLTPNLNHNSAANVRHATPKAPSYIRKSRSCKDVANDTCVSSEAQARVIESHSASTISRIPSPCARFCNGTPLGRSHIRQGHAVNDFGVALHRFETEKNNYHGETISPSSNLECRLPSKQIHRKEYSSERRHASTPILPSEKRNRKENIVPERLLRPISPSRHQYVKTIPKSRTMGMISSMTSSFSRASLNKNYRFSSSVSSTVLDEIPYVKPLYTSSPSLIYEYAVNGFWSGRFTTLLNRYRTEMLEMKLENSSAYHEYMLSASKSSTKNAKSNNLSKTRSRSKGKDSSTPSDRERSTPPEYRNESEFMEEDEKQRIVRVLGDLQGFCQTDLARQSLWDWQLLYARIEKSETYLPEGGRMVDRMGVFKKMGRAVDGASSSMGRRSGISLGKYGDEKKVEREKEKAKPVKKP